MLNFSTLFDSNYLHYGLSLHASLMKHSNKFHLYIFTFDDRCHEILTAMSLENVTLISLAQFEDQQLLDIKSSRTKGEYCWTCTSSTILYVLKNFDVDHCTYIDSDLYFFSDPAPLLSEMGNKSVSIIEHRYTPEYDQTTIAGKYCVQFMTFKNNASALEVLNWWRSACIDWCYSRYEDGKFGDQKYLDDWMTRFSCVHEIQHQGAGVAPWNVGRYQFFLDGDGVNKLIELETRREFSVIFYHFHGLKVLNRHFIQLSPALYDLSDTVKRFIYYPYLKQLLKSESRLSDHGCRISNADTLRLWELIKSYFPKHIRRNIRKNIQRYRNL